MSCWWWGDSIKSGFGYYSAISSFSPQLKMSRIRLYFPPSFVFPPQSFLCMPFVSSVNTHVTSGNRYPGTFAKAELCRHLQNGPVLRENMKTGPVIHIFLSAWAACSCHFATSNFQILMGLKEISCFSDLPQVLLKGPGFLLSVCAMF